MPIDRTFDMSNKGGHNELCPRLFTMKRVTHMYRCALEVIVV